VSILLKLWVTSVTDWCAVSAPRVRSCELSSWIQWWRFVSTPTVYVISRTSSLNHSTSSVQHAAPCLSCYDLTTYADVATSRSLLETCSATSASCLPIYMNTSMQSKWHSVRVVLHWYQVQYPVVYAFITSHLLWTLSCLLYKSEFQ